MRRRAFIKLATAWAGFGAVLPAAAELAKKRMVALVLTSVPQSQIAGVEPVFPPARAFVHQLRDLGWVDGQTILLELRSLEGNPERAPAVLAELVREGADVIVLGGARWLHDAALAATRTTPLVTLFQDDPVAAGLVTSLARPGGNLTGVAQTTGPEFFRKRLQILKEIAPSLSRAALLGPNGVVEQDRVLPQNAGVTVIPVQVDVAEQLGAAFEAILQQHVDGLMVAGSAVTYSDYPRIVAFSAERRLPAIYGFREAVQGGGLVSYGTSIPGIFGQMARLTDRILKGARPQDLPTEQATSFELVVNAKTAKALDLLIPSTMLALADEIIE
jgi:putative tryptophan/tyrosine transport system substrate-binding protein